MQAPNPSSSAPPRPRLQAFGFASFLALWLIALPLFLAGLVLGIDANLRPYLLKMDREALFLIVLKADIRADEASRLAEEWRQAGHWKEARILSAAEHLERTEELKRWTEDAANRDLLDPLPFTIELVPRTALDPALPPDKMVRPLAEAPEVESIFYDHKGINWMRKISAGWNGLRILLLFVVAFIALVGAAMAGYVHARFLGLAGTISPGAQLTAALPACCSGIMAVAALAILYGLLSFGMGLPLMFLEWPAILLLVATGFALGILVAAANVWARSRLGRIILPLLVAGTFALPGASPAQMALPSAGGESAPGLSARDAAERKALEDQITREVAEKEKVIAYLNDWLHRTDEERQLDQQNQRLLQIKQSLYGDSYRSAQDLSDGYAAEAGRFCAALAVGATPLTSAPASSSGRARQAAVLRILHTSANKSLFLLDVYRKEAKRQLAAMEELSEEQLQMDLFARVAGRSLEAIEAEKQKVEAERLELLQRRTLLQMNPQEAMHSMASAPQPSPEPRSAARPLSTSPRRAPQENLAHILAVPVGSLIHAVHAGRVLYAARFTGLGLTVIVEHDGGLSTLYGFLSEIVVKPGQAIQKGDYIGAAGIIRPQGIQGIRFEVRENGRLVPITRAPGINVSNIDALLQGEGK